MDAPNPLARTTVTDTTNAPSPNAQEQAMAYAVVLLWSAAEPHRVGQLAFLDPFEEIFVGRGDGKPRKYAQFGWHRPGKDLAVRPGEELLAGEKISRVHLRFTASAVGVDMLNLGRRSTLVNGKECAEKATLQLDVNDTILIAKQALFLVVRRPRVLPMPPGWHELHPFGEPDVGGIVGESLQAWQLRCRLELAALYDKHVLIRGETGTGKEMAAAVVHNRSKRAGGKFTALNAASVASSILESELFGIVADYPNKGTPARNGLVGDADRGTFFLDEIGDCPGKMQKKLLRLLECGEYIRVGETTVRRVDVRVVGATHRGDGAFREDFRGRFKMVVQLDPLRARREDIPLLARRLLVLAVEPYAERRARLFFVGASGRLEPKLSGFLVDYLVRHPLKRNTR